MTRRTGSSQDQRGMISVVELLVILAVLFVVGLAVYMIHRAQASKPVTASKQQTAQPQSATTNWKTANSNDGFSYKYPTTNGCTPFLTETDKTSQNYALGERVNAAGLNCALGPGAVATPFLLSTAVAGSPEDRGVNYGAKQMADNSSYQLASETTVTKNGLTGTRWEYQSKDSSSASIIYYYFKTKDLSFAISINDGGAKPGGFDVTATGEQIYATLSLSK